ncbi:hypothetical protein BKA66DRAFT_585989 [Pyrenochaeta sp. MPI-SDFR-AT-0127]|nr:hypothetical protein BKA66DRAFT_585989 [Pyrenochaeta sp. MPI-SDFR-AT-0127]
MADSDEYHKAVQGRVQNLLSGRKDQDTDKRALEVIVEGMKTYRSFKEERAKEDSKPDISEDRRRDRSRKRQYDTARDKQRNRPRYERHESPRIKRREKGRDRQRHERSIPDLVLEGPSNNDPRYMMSGENAKASKFPDRAQVSPHGSFHRPRIRHRKFTAPADQGRYTEFPTRRQDPDKSFYVDLPKFKAKKVLTLGLGDHFINTYKHIKAEHEGEYRSKRKKKAIVKGSESGEDWQNGEEARKEVRRLHEDGNGRRVVDLVPRKCLEDAISLMAKVLVPSPDRLSPRLQHERNIKRDEIKSPEGRVLGESDVLSSLQTENENHDIPVSPREDGKSAANVGQLGHEEALCSQDAEVHEHAQAVEGQKQAGSDEGSNDTETLYIPH